MTKSNSLWRVYYNDGTVFSSKDGVAEDAPLDGIQLIVEDRNGQPQYHWGREFYFWTGDCWQSGYQADFERWVRALTKQIKYGVVMTDEGFKKYLGMIDGRNS